MRLADRHQQGEGEEDLHGGGAEVFECSECCKGPFAYIRLMIYVVKWASVFNIFNGIFRFERIVF